MDTPDRGSGGFAGPTFPVPQEAQEMRQANSQEPQLSPLRKEVCIRRSTQSPPQVEAQRGRRQPRGNRQHGDVQQGELDDQLIFDLTAQSNNYHRIKFKYFPFYLLLPTNTSKHHKITLNINVFFANIVNVSLSQIFLFLDLHVQPFTSSLTSLICFFNLSFSSFAASYSRFNFPPSTSAPPPSMRFRQSTALPGFSGSSYSCTRILVNWSTAPVFSRYFLNSYFLDSTPPCINPHVPATSQYQVLYSLITEFKIRTMKAILVIMIIAIANATNNSAEKELKYTEDLDQFLQNQRQQMERFMGCWMTVRDYSPIRNEDYSISLVKECMKRVTKHDTRTKISQFVGKNTTLPKQLEEIVTPQEISALLAVQRELSEFDKKLIDFLKKYQEELGKTQAGKERAAMKEKVDEQLAKRQKYYLGFIPANRYTFILLLITGGIFLILLCNCCTFRNPRTQKKEEERKKKWEKVQLKRINTQEYQEALKKLIKPKKA